MVPPVAGPIALKYPATMFDCEYVALSSFFIPYNNPDVEILNFPAPTPTGIGPTDTSPFLKSVLYDKLLPESQIRVSIFSFAFVSLSLAVILVSISSYAMMSPFSIFSLFSSMSLFLYSSYSSLVA